MRIKVLHVYKTFFPETKGGVEHTIHSLSRDLKDHNIECKVLCLTNKKIKSVEIFDGIEVIRYPQTSNFSSCPTSLSLLLNFKRESEWADLIHLHYPWPFGDLLSLVASSSKKKLVTSHSDIVKQKYLKALYKPLEQYFLRKACGITATSPNYLASSKNLKKFSQKVTVVPHGINEKYYPKPDLGQCSQIQQKYGNRFTLFVGQLRYYKGLHLLLEAAKDLPTNLLILGKGSEERKLRELCKKLDIQNVFFLGQLDDGEKVNYINACYILALPSHLRSEAYGLSLIEGAMLSKPLLSCKIGSGTDYINVDSSTGIVAEPNVESIKKGLALLLSNREMAKTMGKNARKRFEKLFTSDIMCKKMAALIKSLV
jgi:O-antigen biosynthesis rhamnosyltransferase